MEALVLVYLVEKKSKDVKFYLNPCFFWNRFVKKGQYFNNTPSKGAHH